MATNDPRPRRKSTIRNLSRGGGVFPVRDVSSKGRLPRGGLGSTSVTGKGPAKGVKPRMKMDPLTLEAMRRRVEIERKFGGKIPTVLPKKGRPLTAQEYDALMKSARRQETAEDRARFFLTLKGEAKRLYPDRIKKIPFFSKDIKNKKARLQDPRDPAQKPRRKK